MSAAFLTGLKEPAAENEFAMQASRALQSTGVDGSAVQPHIAALLKVYQRLGVVEERVETPSESRTRWELRRREALLATEARERRRQGRMEAKIVFREQSEEIYASSPIQPGFLFWRSLLKNPDCPVSRLHVNIPDSLLVLDKLYWARTLPSGSVQCLEQFSIIDLYRSFRPENEARCAVMRVPEDRCAETKSVMLSWQEFSDKVLKSQLPRSGVLQKYISGRSGSRPTTTRLFFVSQSKDKKASSGFAISNIESARGSIVRMESGLEVIPLCSAALAQVAEKGRVVVEYLQLAHKVRIEEIVLDFIRDAHDEYWLIGCKGFKLDTAAQRARELRAAEEEGKTLLEVREMRAEQLEQQLSAMQCKMCLLPYRADELCHVLPFKLLLIYKQRMNHHVLDLSHLRVSSIDFLSHSVRLCDICYLLVLQENELLQTEMCLANALNVPMQKPRLLDAVDFQHPTFMPSALQQSRLLFYFKSLDNVLPRTHLAYTFLGRHYSVQLEAADVKKACLHYIFAPEGTLAEHCRTLEVEFRVLQGARVMWTGSCKPLSLFTVSDAVAKVQPFSLLLFAGGCVQATLSLLVGLVLDKTVSSKEVLTTIERVGTLYVPEPDFFSSEPLPAAWIEAFECEYAGVDPSIILDSSEELHAMYSPVLSRQTMLAAPLGSSKVLHMNVDLNPSGKLHRVAPASKRPLHSPTLSVPRLPSIEAVTTKLLARPQSRRTVCRTPTTASTSRVLYQVDVNKLKSPTFLSARHSGTPSSATRESEEPHEVGTIELRDVVTNYMRKKTRSLPSQESIPSSRSEGKTPRPEKAKESRKLKVLV